MEDRGVGRIDRGSPPPPTGVARAAEEIVSSERSFVDDMKILRSVFLGPLSEYIKLLLQGMVRADEIGRPQELGFVVDRLLVALDGVVKFSHTFLEEIIETQSNGRWRHVFEKHEAAMAKNLGRYVAAYNAVWSEFSEYRKRSTAIEAFLRCCELQPGNTRRQTLASLAIMPVQRGPRYVLLLDELQKRAQKADFSYEEHGGDDSKALEDALACARRAAKAIDAEIRAEESRRADLRRVATLFLHSETVKTWTLSTCKRQVIREDTFRRTTQRRGGVDSIFIIFDTNLAYGDNSTNETSIGPSSTLKRIRRRSANLSLGPTTHQDIRPPSPTNLDPSLTHNNNTASGNNSTATSANTKRPVYALRRDLKLIDCYAARGDDRLGGLMSSASSAVALDPWEVLVCCGNEAFVLAAPTPTAAAQWVDILNATADQCRSASLSRSKEHFFVSAHVHRQSRVTLAEYEVARLSGGPIETYLARPRGAMGIIPMPPSRPSMNEKLNTADDNTVRTSSATASAGVQQDSRPNPLQRQNGHAIFPENTEIAKGPDLVTLTVRLGREGLGIELRNEGDEVVVTGIAVPSAAHDAGLRRGDTIAAVANLRVKSTDDVVASLHTLAATGHTELALLVRRDSRGRSGQQFPSPDEFMTTATSTAFSQPPASVNDSSLSPAWSSSQAEALAQNATDNCANCTGSTQYGLPKRLSEPSIESQALAMGFNPDDVVRAVEGGATELNDIALWIIDHADDSIPTSPESSKRNSTSTRNSDSHSAPPPPYSAALAYTTTSPVSPLPPASPSGASRGQRRSSSPLGIRGPPPPLPPTPPPSPPRGSTTQPYINEPPPPYSRPPQWH